MPPFFHLSEHLACKTTLPLDMELLRLLAPDLPSNRSPDLSEKIQLRLFNSKSIGIYAVVGVGLIEHKDIKHRLTLQ